LERAGQSIANAALEPGTNVSIFYLFGVGQEGKNVIDTILLACPLVALTPGLK